MIQNLAARQTGFTSNTFLVTGERTVLVDVGNEFDIVDEATDYVDDVDAIVLTHTHPDHIGNLDSVVNAFDIDVWGYDTSQPGVDHELEDGGTVTLGNETYDILHTPGHKNDHVCLYGHSGDVLFAGDLVFANGGFGRTDLDEGNRRQLIESINRVADTVDETLEALHVGHGQSVTANPYHDIELALQAAKMSA
ncbi:MBL fold metallo-hydrolase [Halovenus rubra]|uniref:MBL fold metallo-hydrolase n=2 Tax=Halovenus rubra TaxID=869890 RepID=A0ACC7E3K2_9EURY|nr:MBL fold metallo-hydrolase [Halovenus rubra]